MNIEKYIVNNAEDNSAEEKWINYLEFIKDLKNLIIHPKMEFNIEENKKYYCNGIDIPKDRLDKLKKRYNLQKVINIDNADYIFTSKYVKLEIEEYPIAGTHVNLYISSDLGKNHISYVTRINNIFKHDRSLEPTNTFINTRISNFSKSLLGTNDTLKSAVIVTRLHYAKKIYDYYSKYLINKPHIDISLLVEQEFPLLYHTDFISDFYNKLISNNSRYMTVLGLYSNYNLQSIKLLLRQYIIKRDKNIMKLVDELQNKDIYTKYLLKNLLQPIRVDREDLKNLYYFTRMANKYRYYENIKLKADKYIENEIIKIKSKYIIENEK